MLFSRIFLLLASVGVLFSCTQNASPETKTPDQAQKVVDLAIEAHGGETYQNSRYRFDFRGKSYSWYLAGGQYHYTRTFQDSLGLIEDHLSNEGFVRTLDGDRIPITHEQDSMYSNSVNSVFYFALLPYGLNAPAVKKRYLGEESIKGKAYDKIEVRFAEEGGGKDFEDVYVYWFGQEDHRLDYLAYSYLTDGGGLRFRKAYNSRMVGKIRFQDYVNYKAEVIPGRTPDQLAAMYEAGQLDSLSSIINENIQLQ
ncbi:MAG: DUF6503 family protein [Bacteroidota bacterium]